MSKAEIQAKLAEWKLPPWFLSVYNALVIGVFFLIALGGSVRIMKAGLACPDWPLCFGDVIPDYHPQVYFEFIHRVVAGVVAIATLILHVFLFRSRAPRAVKLLAGFALLLLAAQIVFGGLTVLLLLQSYVVATHLILGTGFFSTLLWIYLSLKPSPATGVEPSWLARWSLFMVLAVYGQILLGGLVASHFASLVCIDFPTCHGEWFPTFSGIIGLHVIHRLGAYCIFIFALINALLMRKFAAHARLRKLSGVLFLCVCGQVCLGIANVMLLTPPLIAVSHLALGVGVLSVAFRQLHCLRGMVSTRRSPAVDTASVAGPDGRLSFT
jgi:cytochrome c oxidase assembly protein subunit 15